MYAELRPGITAAPRDLWRIEILGGLKATRNGLEVRSFAARRVAALLARLALSPTRSVPREELMDLFWGDMDVDAARHNLRQTLFSLRRALEVPGGSSVVRADHDNIWLDVSSVTTDVEEFEEASRRAKHRPRPEAIGDLTRAAELYRGELLAGQYAEWILPERRRLETAYLAVLNDLQQFLLDEGEPLRAAQYAIRVVAANPYEEEAHLTVMQLFAAARRPDLVERQIVDMRRLLRDELSEDPSPDTNSRSDRLLAQSREPAMESSQMASEVSKFSRSGLEVRRKGSVRMVVTASLLAALLTSAIHYTTSGARFTPTSGPESDFQRLASIRVGSDGGPDSRASHASLCLTLAEQAWSAWYGPDEERWIRHLEAGHDDVRLAMRRFLECDPEKAVQLAGAMTRFWYLRDHAREGHRWLAAALEKSQRIRNESRARALVGAAFLSDIHGSAQETQCKEALRIYKERGDWWGIGHTLRHLGYFASERQETALARRRYDEALAIFDRIRDPRGQAVTLLCLGLLAPDTDSPVAIQRSRAWGGRSLELFTKIGNAWGVGMARMQQAVVANLDRRPREAESLFLASMTDEAGAAITVRELETQATVELIRGNGTASRSLFVKALATARDQGDRMSAARLLEFYSRMFREPGQERWVRLLAASARLNRDIGARQEARYVTWRIEVERQLRDGMSEERFAAAYREGDSLSWTEAVDEALMAMPSDPR